MVWLYCIFFGAGVAGFAYTKLGKRAGYGNSQNVFIICVVSFILATLFFYTLLRLVLNVQ